MDTDDEKYIEYLVRGIHTAQDSVFATCLVRPFWFIPDDNETVNGQLIGNYERRGRHLHAFRSATGAVRRVRLAILEVREIDLLIADAFLSVDCGGQKESFGGDLPEIHWFSTDPNGDGVCLLWAAPEGDATTLRDMMVFDSKLVLAFAFKISWDAIDPGTANLTRNYVNAVFSDASEEVSFGSGKSKARTYRSFKALLGRLNADGGQTTQITRVVKKLSEDVVSAIWPGVAKDCVDTSSLLTAYTDLVTAIEEGRVSYRDKVCVRVPRDGAQTATDSFMVSWRVNANRLRNGN